MAIQRKRLTILTIGSIPLMMTLGNSILVPIFPNMKTSLNISQMQVSLTITVFSIAAALYIPIAGYLSDRLTRKVILLPSLLLFGFGGLLSGLAATWIRDPYIWILIGRTLQGIGAAGTSPVAMALTGDLFKGGEQSRVLGIYEASNGLGKVLSPILGAIAGIFAWYAVFYIFPIFAFISFILTWLFVKEKGIRENPPPFRKYVRNIGRTFKSEGRWLFVMYFAGWTCLFTLFGILFYLSDVLENTYNFHGVVKGLILAIPLLIMVSTAYITGSKIGKQLRRMKLLMISGFLAMTVSYGLLIFIQSIIPFLSILALSSIGAGLVLPCVNSMITGSVAKEQRGFVASLYGSVRFIGVAAGPPIFARLLEWSRTGMFLSIAILTFVVAILILWLVRVKGTDNKREKKPTFTYQYT